MAKERIYAVSIRGHGTFTKRDRLKSQPEAAFLLSFGNFYSALKHNIRAKKQSNIMCL